MTSSRRTDAYRVSLSALLISLMLVLGYVESLIPTGVPGIKIGLSNGVLIFAVYMLGIPTAYILMALKVVLSGLLFSGVTGMLYAFAGGLVSLTLMSLLSRFKRLSPIIVSVAGGVTHNLGQVAVALIILSPVRQMLYYLGLLVLTGAVCGAATGLAAVSVMRHLKLTRLRPAGHKGDKKREWLLVAVAVLAVGAGLTFACIRMKQASPVSVVEEDGNDSPFLKPEDLPFGLGIPGK